MSGSRVFLSYCREDLDNATWLQQQLEAAGFKVWWDQNLLGGENFDNRIDKEIKNCDAIVICLSDKLDRKRSSFVYEEIVRAIKIYRKLPPDSIFLIPVRFANCSVPEIKINHDSTLASLERVDLFPDTSKHENLSKLFASIAASTKKNNTAERFEFAMKNGRVEFEKGEYEAAVEEFNLAISIKSDSHLAHRNRARAYMRLGDDKHALHDLTTAIGRRPSDVEAFILRGQLYHKHKDYDLAIKDFNDALREDEYNVRALKNRACSHFERGAHDLALKDCMRALKMDDRDAENHNNIGVIYTEMGKYELAVDMFGEALRCNPAHKSARFGRAYAYHLAKQYKQAIHEYKKAIEIDGAYLRAYFCLGSAYYSIEEYQLAIGEFSKVIWLDDGHISGYVGRGHSYLKRELYEKAVQDAESAIDLIQKESGIKDNRAYLLRANVKLLMRYAEECANDATKAIEIEESSKAYRLRSAAYAQLGMEEKAKADKKRAEELDGKRSGIFGIVGRLFSRGNRGSLRPAERIAY